MKTYFCWVPNHTGIGYNEKTDSAAKSTLELPHDTIGVPYTDLNIVSASKLFPLG